MAETNQEIEGLIPSLTDAEAELIGKDLAGLLHLKYKFGKYNTTWGSKTHQGLARAVVRFMHGKLSGIRGSNGES